MAAPANSWLSNPPNLNKNTEAVAAAIWAQVQNNYGNKPANLSKLKKVKNLIKEEYYKPKPSIFNRFKGAFARKPASATTVSASTPAVSSEAQERARQLKLNSIASQLRVVSKVKKWYQRVKTAAERKRISKNITARAINSVVAAGKYNNMNVKNLLSKVSGVSNANKNALRRAITAKKLSSNITPVSINNLNSALRSLN